MFTRLGCPSTECLLPFTGALGTACDFTAGASRRRSLKEIIHVVTQTLAGRRRGRFAWRGRPGADLRLGLGRAWRLARWLAWRLRLGRAAGLCRRPRLRLWRL